MYTSLYSCRAANNNSHARTHSDINSFSCLSVVSKTFYSVFKILFLLYIKTRVLQCTKRVSEVLKKRRDLLGKRLLRLLVIKLDKDEVTQQSLFTHTHTAFTRKNGFYSTTYSLSSLLYNWICVFFVWKKKNI